MAASLTDSKNILAQLRCELHQDSWENLYKEMWWVCICVLLCIWDANLHGWCSKAGNKVGALRSVASSSAEALALGWTLFEGRGGQYFFKNIEYVLNVIDILKLKLTWRIPVPCAIVSGSTMKSETLVMMAVQSSQVQSPRKLFTCWRYFWSKLTMQET